MIPNFQSRGAKKPTDKAMLKSACLFVFEEVMPRQPCSVTVCGLKSVTSDRE